MPAGAPDRDARLDVLDIHLEATVPLRIFELGPLSVAERLRLAAEASAQIAAHGDNILFPGPRRGDTASAVSWLVTGLAVAAFQPGGVRFRQLAWCAAHLGRRWAPDEYPCSACLAQEAKPRTAARQLRARDQPGACRAGGLVPRAVSRLPGGPAIVVRAGQPEADAVISSSVFGMPSSAARRSAIR